MTVMTSASRFTRSDDLSYNRCCGCRDPIRLSGWSNS